MKHGHEYRVKLLAGETPLSSFLWHTSNVLMHPVVKQFIFITSIVITALALKMNSDSLKWIYIGIAGTLVALWLLISACRFYLFVRVWLRLGVKELLHEIWDNLSKDRY